MTAPHLGGAYEQGDANTTMPDVWGYLLVKYDLKQVLDIGCGFGHTMQWFSQNGLCKVVGIDGWDEAVKKCVVPGAAVLHDFTKGPCPDVVSPFDLVWSAEFLEHVEEKYIPNFMAAFRLGRVACVTHAEPGQHGHHHVNCQTTEYWVRVFAEYGFEHVEEETRMFRQTDRWRAPWGRRTLTMFKRVR